MKVQNWNSQWHFEYGAANNWDPASASESVEVILPHDAMILEKRDPLTENGGNTGYYPGNTYRYSKNFFVPLEWEEQEVYLEFDGVYKDARVIVNSALAMQWPYGYSRFHVKLNDFLEYGVENQIVVTADTSDESDSRWYTGGGIYREVSLYTAPKFHFGLHETIIKTVDLEDDYAVIQIDSTLKNLSYSRKNGTVHIQIIDPDGATVGEDSILITALCNEDTKIRSKIGILHPLAWGCEAPSLYTAKLTLLQNNSTVDEETIRFGIRTLQLDARHGLRINGQQTKLRGACIHHDNGVIGAISLPSAEKRRILKLKEMGFNCIRSAHNSASEALLKVCDEIGMLVMDEAFDIWTTHKLKHDYSDDFLGWWERDLTAMIQKDRNHPSVILYSVGNEIDEAGTPHGARWNRKMADAIRAIDDTRFITNGINGMVVIMDQMSDLLPGLMKEIDGSGDGSDDLNNLISISGGLTGDKLFSNPLIGERTEEIFGAMDIAGMNYMPIRYQIDHEQHPNRIFLGTESFPADIARLWKLVQENDYVIGDMTWAGYDYLGEAGCGIFRYDGKPNFGAEWPARTAYIGDINLIGGRRPISYYKEIVFGLRKNPYFSVEYPQYHGLIPTKTPWMLYNDIAGWTWPGFEGKPITVRVFSASDEVVLYLNGACLGRKPAGPANRFIAEFELVYEPGTLTAKGYSGGSFDGEASICTAGRSISLSVYADKDVINADGSDLAFLNIAFVDEIGVIAHNEKRTIYVEVEGSGKLQGLGSADPTSEGNYFDHMTDAFEGEALAVIRGCGKAGEITVKIKAEGLQDIELKLNAM